MMNQGFVLTRDKFGNYINVPWAGSSYIIKHWPQKGMEMLRDDLEREIIMNEQKMKTESSFSLRSEDTVAPTSIFSCRPRLRSRRSLSEASVYRANSRYSLKTGVSQDNKALDRLMHCFWLCSPGCQETA